MKKVLFSLGLLGFLPLSAAQKRINLELENKNVGTTFRDTIDCLNAINRLPKSQGYSQLGAMLGESARRAVLLNYVLHKGLYVKGLQEISREVFLRNYVEKEKVNAEKYNYPIISPLLMKVTGSDEAFIPWFTTLQKEQMIIRDSLAACLQVAHSSSRPTISSRL